MFNPELPSYQAGGNTEELVVRWAANLLIITYYLELLCFRSSSPTPSSALIPHLLISISKQVQERLCSLLKRHTRWGWLLRVHGFWPAAPGLPENFLEIQNLRPHPRVTKSKSAF